MTVGGWNQLEGAIPVEIAYVWSTSAGLLRRPLEPRRTAGGRCAGGAAGYVRAVAGPGWFDRDKIGFEQPSVNAGLLGVLTLLIVPVQISLVVFAMRGFQQGWNVELERRDPRGRRSPPRALRPQPA